MAMFDSYVSLPEGMLFFIDFSIFLRIAGRGFSDLFASEGYWMSCPSPIVVTIADSYPIRNRLFVYPVLSIRCDPGASFFNM